MAEASISKTCRRCLRELPVAEFSPAKRTKDHLKSWCKPCRRAYARETHARDSARINERFRKWRASKGAEQREKTRVRMAAWRKANRARSRQIDRAYYRRNKYKVYEKVARRQKAIRVQAHLAKPYKAEIAAIYAECARITAETGIRHEVDHIVPVRGFRVCGLHVPWNLQIITAEANWSKGNSPVDYLNWHGFTGPGRETEARAKSTTGERRPAVPVVE